MRATASLRRPDPVYRIRTPKETVDRLAKAMTDAIRSPDLQAKLQDYGMEPTGLGPEELQLRLMTTRLTLGAERTIGPIAYEVELESELTPELQLLDAFAKGGYTRVADMIEKSVPEAEREKAAQTYLKIVNGAAFEAYNLSRERSGKQAEIPNEENQQFLQESLNAISDLYF